jgi:hypothetical protein
MATYDIGGGSRIWTGVYEYQSGGTSYFMAQYGFMASTSLTEVGSHRTRAEAEAALEALALRMGGKAVQS